MAQTSMHRADVQSLPCSAHRLPCLLAASTLPPGSVRNPGRHSHLHLQTHHVIPCLSSALPQPSSHGVFYSSLCSGCRDSCEDHGGPIPSSFSAIALAKCLTVDLNLPPTSAPHCSVTLALLLLQHVGTTVLPPGLPPSPPAALSPGIISEAPRPGPFGAASCVISTPILTPSDCLYLSLTHLICCQSPCPECQLHEGRFLFS